MTLGGGIGDGMPQHDALRYSVRLRSVLIVVAVMIALIIGAIVVLT
ncbi:MAG: hypothetical protein ABIQ73_18790 [Acidimicrobiales bacterium]